MCVSPYFPRVCLSFFPSHKENTLFFELQTFWLYQDPDNITYFAWTLWFFLVDTSWHNVYALWKFAPISATYGWQNFEKWESPVIDFLFPFLYEVGNKLEAKWNETSSQFFLCILFYKFQ